MPCRMGLPIFFIFCDIALFISLIGIWIESRLLISMRAVGILAPQAIWLLDFAAHFGGTKITGVTDYMFDSTKPLLLRGLSLFHGWLPILLAYLLTRVGYDDRALKAWTMLTWIVLPVCYFLMPGPTPDAGWAAVNINYVYGLSDTAPQSWMHPLLWLTTLMMVFPVLLYLPTHLVLHRWEPSSTQPGSKVQIA